MTSIWTMDQGEDVTNDLITHISSSDPNIDIDDLNVRQGQGAVDSRRVFVVHGRNEAAREAMFVFLRALGLQPLEWSEAVRATGKASPYIGEILDSAFSRAHAVLVLFTPDDEVRLKERFWADNEPVHETKLYGQARPNVLFEVGMAMGRNQDRTILVQLGQLRPFSDIDGRHAIRIGGSAPEWRKELALRLQSAGCPVNLEGPCWRSAGDFEAAVNSSEAEPRSDGTDALALEYRRFSEILKASRMIRNRISLFLSPGNQVKTATDGQDIAIALGALAGQMSALGMNELNERLEGQGGIGEKLKGILEMLRYLEMLIQGRNFERPKRELASLVKPSMSGTQ